MSAMAAAARFYFDYVSPNAYLAWRQLRAIAERHGVAIEPVPVLFAGLLEAHGQLGPAEVPAKMGWMVKNNLRKAALQPAR
jgi:2-hydroxychromene-2-carboxylate isomerase